MDMFSLGLVGYNDVADNHCCDGDLTAGCPAEGMASGSTVCPGAHSPGLVSPMYRVRDWTANTNAVCDFSAGSLREVEKKQET